MTTSLIKAIALSTALGLATVGLPAAAQDSDDNPPGPRGGPGTNWENPPGARGGPGVGPDRRALRDRDGNPPGPRGGPGTNWENPPGPRGGPGVGPDRRRIHNQPPAPTAAQQRRRAWNATHGDAAARTRWNQANPPTDRPGAARTRWNQANPQADRPAAQRFRLNGGSAFRPAASGARAPARPPARRR